MTEPLEKTLRQLKEDRDRADAIYNEALTGVDLSLRPPPELPEAPPGYDEHQITPLNESWNIVPAAPGGGGIKGRLAGFVWRTVGPFLERQLTFNSRLVDHLNRNVVPHRDLARVTERALAALREHMAQQAETQSRLMFLLQQITLYVDTKDRDAGGNTLVLNASLSALSDSMAKRAESSAVRVERIERHVEARTTALAQAQRDLQTALAVSHRAVAALAREVERPAGSAAPPGAPQAPAAQTPTRAEAFSGPLHAHKYVGFEDQFRGPQEAIRARLESYLPYFAGAADVLDVGCGRGEFLELLASHGISARGIDLNPEMVEVCRARGLDAAHADAVTFLDGLEDACLGGLFAAQVVEHLEPAYLLRFLDLASAKVRPGGRLVLETLNPACWVAFFESYIRDITHVRPLHPETLKYLVLASGFPAATIEYRSPVPEADRLQRASDGTAASGLGEVIDILNANVDKLNARLFTHLDYAIVAAAPAADGPPPA